MSGSNTSLRKLGLATLASSAHALVAEPRGVAYSVDAVAAPAQSFNPTDELHRLWSKFPTVAHVESRQTDATKQQGSVSVKPHNSGLTFLVPTVVGNQTFDMLYDTGSADFWVYSNESSKYQSLEHPVYVPTSSATLMPNYTWSIKYALQGLSISGVVFTDIVKAGPITAKKQAVQAATIIPFEFASDGIMGLAFSSINTVQPVKQKTFFDTVAPTLQRKVFSANLRVNGSGTWDFGFIDSSKFSGEIEYSPVVSEKHWSMAVKEYAVGQGGFGSATIGDVIVDSGSSLTYLPDAVVKDYYSHIPGYVLTEGGSHTFPCNATVPDFRFKVEGGELKVPGSDVNYAVYDQTQGTCSGSITTSLNMRYSVLGNIFMHNYYVVHNEEGSAPKIGFAPQK